MEKNEDFAGKVSLYLFVNQSENKFSFIIYLKTRFTVYELTDERIKLKTGILSQEIDEDAPTTSVANAPPGMVDEPIVRKKKKKKVLFDGRTKAYKQHRERLEAQRERRAKLREKQKSKFVEEILYKY